MLESWGGVADVVVVAVVAGVDVVADVVVVGVDVTASDVMDAWLISCVTASPFCFCPHSGIHNVIHSMPSRA